MINVARNLREPSVPTPIRYARNSTLYYYDPGIHGRAWEIALDAPPGAYNRIHPACAASIYVILTWGMRSREYLMATVTQVMPRDFLFIHGAKGSRSYRIKLSGLCAQIAHWIPLSPGRLVAGVPYYKVYAACVRSGIGSIVPGHKYLARTHAGRYDMAQQTLPFGSSAVSDVLRHRSLTSAHFYDGVNGGPHG